MKFTHFSWLADNGGVVLHVDVYVASGVRNTRDLRDLLLEVAYALESQRDRASICLLPNCGFTQRRLNQEFDQFSRILVDGLGQRLRVLSLGSTSDLPRILAGAYSAQSLRDLQRQVDQALNTKPTSSSQEAVVGMLLHRWVHRLKPIRIPELAVLSGASVPTTYAALKKLDPQSWMRDEDRGIALTRFSAQAWKQWLTACADVTKARFVDRSGSPRSPKKLADLVRKLGRDDIAIGGVLSAMHYFPDLDMTVAPHLDLVVHGNMQADLSFVEQLDPGLVRDDAAVETAHVIVHYLNRPNALFEIQNGVVWAGVLECLVHLWNSEFMHQVEQLINHIAPIGLGTAISD